MKKKTFSHIKALAPAIGISAVCGCAVGVLIFLFKLVSGKVISLSAQLYAFARQDIGYLPVLIAAAAAVGLVASLLLFIEPNCRGGGIPTAVATVRGLFEFRWLRSILMIFPSALLTYLCGVPLGNEGPSVQMGSALGRGTVSLFGSSARPLDRYIMTGGACAGFAAATGAPLSGIIFAFEEAHRKYTPMLFVTSSVSVAASMIVSAILEHFTGVSATLFAISVSAALPLGSIWYAAVPGLVCGAAAIIFTRFYRWVGAVLSGRLARVPLAVRTSVIFALVALCGYFVISATGSGHDLVHAAMESHMTWRVMAAALIFRAVILVVANNSGVTGGLFLPTLAIGALIGSLCAKCFMSAGLLGEEHYALTVALGMVAYMSAASRTPIMAIAFGAEALLSASSLLPTVIAAVTAFLVIELSGEASFSDTVIEKKVAAERAGKRCEIVDAFLEVKAGCFAEGREIRDLPLPPACVVLSVRRDNSKAVTLHVNEGDILHVRYQTYEPAYTSRRLSDIFGEQTDTRESSFEGSERHSVPEA